MNEENLRLFTSDQSREEAAKNGRKGGIASGKSKREAKQFRDIFNLLLGMKLKKGTLNDIEKFGDIEALKGKNLTVQDVIAYAEVLKAVKGDTKAFEVIRDTIGQKPVDVVENHNVEIAVEFGDAEGDDI